MLKRHLLTALVAIATLAVGCSTSPSPTNTTPRPTGSAAPTDDRLPIGAVVATEPVVLRSAPGTGADSTILEAKLYPGMRFSILEGPESASGYVWYLVRIGEIEGWAAAASKEGEPWLASVRNGSVAISRDLPAPGGGLHPQMILLDEDGGARQITFLTAEEVTRRTTPEAALRPVLTCGYGIYEASWSPAGDQIVAAVGSCETAIFAVDTTGDTLRWLGQGRGPSWAPTGTDVAHALNVPYLPCGRQCGGEPLGPWEITLSDAATGQSRALTSNEPWFQAFEPSWSPDGARIAFTGGEYGTGRWDVYLVNADGSDQQRLVEDGFGASWSPDGTRLLFVRPNANQEPEAWVVEADGSSPQRLGGAYAALWSPDGSWIALRTTDEQALLLSADGTRQVDLGQGTVLGWSPDGRTVVMRRGDVPATLVAVDPIDLAERPIAEFGSEMWNYLGWQPIYVPLTP